jgi:hypothetical protein
MEGFKVGDLVEDDYKDKWKIRSILDNGRLACTDLANKKKKTFKQDQVKPTDSPQAGLTWLGGD